MVLGMAALKPTQSNAQAFTDGSNAISVGYGFGSLGAAFYKTLLSSSDNVKTSNLGPVYLKYERGVTDHIGIGLNIAYAANKASSDYIGYDDNFNEVTYTESLTRTTLSVLARLNYHIGHSDKFDPYVGAGIGYRNASWKFKSTDPNYGNFTIPSFLPLGFELTVGARYYFTPNIGLYAEVGAAKSVAQLGVTINMPGK